VEHPASAAQNLSCRDSAKHADGHEASSICTHILEGTLRWDLDPKRPGLWPDPGQSAGYPSPPSASSTPHIRPPVGVVVIGTATAETYLVQVVETQRPPKSSLTLGVYRRDYSSEVSAIIRQELAAEWP
jgi:hypothetical protein